MTRVNNDWDGDASERMGQQVSVPPGSEIDRLTGQVHQAIEDLGCITGELRDRLESVLSPKMERPKDPRKEAAMEAAPRSPLGESLYNMLLSLRSIKEMVTETHERLQL